MELKVKDIKNIKILAKQMKDTEFKTEEFKKGYLKAIGDILDLIIYGELRN